MKDGQWQGQNRQALDSQRPGNRLTAFACTSPSN